MGRGQRDRRRGAESQQAQNERAVEPVPPAAHVVPCPLHAAELFAALWALLWAAFLLRRRLSRRPWEPGPSATRRLRRRRSAVAAAPASAVGRRGHGWGAGLLANYDGSRLAGGASSMSCLICLTWRFFR